MHHIVMWKWQQKGFAHSYTSEHVNIVADMVRRHLNGMEAEVHCITDDARGIDKGVRVHSLWDDHSKMLNRSGARLPSCYRRLKLFDPATQTGLGIPQGHRIVSLDLDSVIANDLRPLLEKPQHFVGWAVRGHHHLRVFNGSMWMFTAGEHEHMWARFDPERTPDRCHQAGFMGSDQAWISYNFAKNPTAGTWCYPQAVSYPKECAARPQLVRGTSVVFFHGKRKPWHPEVHKESPWIKLHWRRSDPSPPGVAQVIASGSQAALG